MELLYKNFDKEIVEKVMNSKRYQRITESKKTIDIEVCKQLYISYRIPIYKIGMLYGVSDVTMKKYLSREGVEMKGHYVGKNSDNTYFEKIDRDDKAYFLGLVRADGCIMDKGSKSNNRKCFSISLTHTDSYILEEFIKKANFITAMTEHHKKDKNPRVGFSIWSYKLCRDLINLGMIPNKSMINSKIPKEIKQNKELLISFIRGYFDGNGIAYSKGYIGFCGDCTLMHEIRDYMVSEYNFNKVKVTYNKENRIYYVTWASRKDRTKFLEIIYHNKKNLYLKRKYKKIKNSLGPLCSDA